MATTEKIQKMSKNVDNKTGSKNTNGANPQKVVEGLNILRGQRQILASQLLKAEAEFNEHKLVIETLDSVEKDRKCFRMVGGVLVERKVGEVEPALVSNRDKMAKLIETLEKQLSEKGQDINGYMEKHNIQVRGAGNKKEIEESSKEDSAKSSDAKNAGVLVNTK